MKNSKGLWMAILGIFACVACCAFPIFTSLFSIAVLAWLVGWLKNIVVLLAAAVLFRIILRWRRKMILAACPVDCNCKPKKCGAVHASED